MPLSHYFMQNTNETIKKSLKSYIGLKSNCPYINVCVESKQDSFRCMAYLLCTTYTQLLGLDLNKKDDSRMKLSELEEEINPKLEKL